MKLFGGSLVKGMIITMEHFVQTYISDFRKFFKKYDKKAMRPNAEDYKGIFTVQYPEEKTYVHENFRVLPVLIYEKDKGKEEGIRCTACGVCAKVCPPQCIWIVMGKDTTGKPSKKPSEFYIDTDVCMNCGLCAEYCPFNAIKMDQNLELANDEKLKSHIHDLNTMLVDTDYYAKTHPKAWAEEQSRKAKKEQAKSVAK